MLFGQTAESNPALVRCREALARGFGVRPDSFSSAFVITDPFVGFAVEGAAIAATLADSEQPELRTLRALATAVPSQVFPVHIGMGVGLAIRGLRPDSFAAPDGGFYPKVIDGWGFAKATADPDKYVARALVPDEVAREEMAAFDQGLGRAIWWLADCQVDAVKAAVLNIESSRLFDVWSGVAFAAAFAGGATADAFTAMKAAAPHGSVELGVWTAAGPRSLAANPTEATQLACATVLGRSVAEVGSRSLALLNEMRSSPPPEGAYLGWRRRLLTECVQERATP